MVLMRKEVVSFLSFNRRFLKCKDLVQSEFLVIIIMKQIFIKIIVLLAACSTCTSKSIGERGKIYEKKNIYKNKELILMKNIKLLNHQ